MKRFFKGMSRNQVIAYITLKTLLIGFIISLMVMTTSCGLYQMVTYPKEIKEQGGVINRDITTYQYELMDGKTVTTKKPVPTQTYFYLYKKDAKFFWNIRRSQLEVKESFYPQDLTLVMTNFIESKTVDEKATWILEEVTTGEIWTLVTLPWASQDYGYFYVLSKVEDERKIVYSVHVKNMIIH